MDWQSAKMKRHDPELLRIVPFSRFCPEDFLKECTYKWLNKKQLSKVCKREIEANQLQPVCQQRDHMESPRNTDSKARLQGNS